MEDQTDTLSPSAIIIMNSFESDNNDISSSGHRRPEDRSRSFHKALSLRNVQVNARGGGEEGVLLPSQSQGRTEYLGEKVGYYGGSNRSGGGGGNNFIDDNCISDDDDHEELTSLLTSSPPRQRIPAIPSRRKLQPLSITTPQEDDDYYAGDCNNSNSMIRIPSTRLPPIRGSLYDRYHRRQRFVHYYKWCGCCCNNHHCCACYDESSFRWVTCCCCRLLLLVFLLGGISFVATQLVWEESSSTVSSSQVKPHGGGAAAGTMIDDDILDLVSSPSSSTSSSSRIRGDYSTVQNMDDLLVLAAKVPIMCYDSTSTTTSATGNKNKIDNRRKKNADTIQDCPCAVLDSDDDAINSRTTPIPGTLPGWDETFERNKKLASLAQPLFFDTISDSPTDNLTLPPLPTTTTPNVVFLGDSIIERWYGTKLGKAESPDDIDENGKVFTELFHGSDSDNDSHAIRGLPLGIAGDQTPNLLWRLENGELPNVLQPHVFVLLIGTNDLSKDWCSAENVVVGIVRIVELLLEERPTATVLLHGLLPRTTDRDGYLNQGRTIGSGIRDWSSYFNHGRDEDGDSPNFWPEIQIINDELRGEFRASYVC